MRRALAFLTPLGGAAVPDARTLDWFPFAGSVIGLVLGGGWWLAREVWTPLTAAGVVVAADLALTGALHFDGLVDSADGLLPHLPPDRRLDVMADPAVGAFGLAVGVSVLLMRFAALVSLGDARPFLLAALWCASRTSMTAAARLVPYARPGGLADAFTGRRSPVPAIVGAGLALGLGLFDGMDAVVSAAAVIAVFAAATAVHTLAWRRLGGFTGDTLGAAGVVGETAGLLVAALA